MSWHKKYNFEILSKVVIYLKIFFINYVLLYRDMNYEKIFL